MSDVTTGNIIMASDQPTSPNNDNLDELTKTAAYVQTFTIHPPYTMRPDRAFGVDSLTNPTYVLMSTPDSTASGEAIVRMSKSGVVTDWVPHATIADLVVGTNYNIRPSGLSVDDQGRIYVIATLYNSLSAHGGHTRIQRLHPDGTNDTTFDAAPVVIGTNLNQLPDSNHTFSSWGCISPDGHYFYSSEFSRDTFVSFPTTNYHSIIEYDLTNSMSSRIVKTYTYTTTHPSPTTSSSSGCNYIEGVTVDPDGDLWVAYERDNLRTTDESSTNNGHLTSNDCSALIDHLKPDGTLVATFDIGAADPVWDSQNTAVPQANETDPGAPAQFVWVGRVLYGQLEFEGQYFSDINSSGRTKFFTLDTTTGAITILPGFDDFYSRFAGGSLPYVIFGTDCGIIVGTDNGYIAHRDALGVWTRTYDAGGSHLAGTNTIVSMEAHPGNPAKVTALQTSDASFTINAIVKSPDGGVTWSSITPVPSNIGVPQGLVMGIDENGNLYTTGPTGGNVLKSADQGATWVEVRAVPGGIHAFWVGDGYIWFLTGGGTPLQRMDYDGSNLTGFAWVAYRNQNWIRGNKGSHLLYVFEDPRGFADSVATIDTTDPTAPVITDLGNFTTTFSSPKSIYATSVTNSVNIAWTRSTDRSTGALWRSANKGVTWTKTQTDTSHLTFASFNNGGDSTGGFDDSLYLPIDVNGNEIWVATTYPYIFHSTDQGQTWVEESYNGPTVGTPVQWLSIIAHSCNTGGHFVGPTTPSISPGFMWNCIIG